MPSLSSCADITCQSGSDCVCTACIPLRGLLDVIQAMDSAQKMPAMRVGATCVRVQEASISWEKRQAEVRAKLQQDTDAAAWNSWWENLGGEQCGV